MTSWVTASTKMPKQNSDLENKTEIYCPVGFECSMFESRPELCKGRFSKCSNYQIEFERYMQFILHPVKEINPE